MELRTESNPDYIAKVEQRFPGTGKIITMYRYFKQARRLISFRVFVDKSGGRKVSESRWSIMNGVEPQRFLDVMGNHAANKSLRFIGLIGDN